MPGAFAHMVAADRAKQAAESQGLHLIARSTIEFPQWLQAGTVGPDYSYLHHLRSHDSSDSWADLMHYNRTGDVVRSGIQWLSEWTGDRTSIVFQRAVACLSGYIRAIDMADNSLILFRHAATENGLLYADSGDK